MRFNAQSFGWKAKSGIHLFNNFILGKLITVNKPPTKQLYEKGLSDFWFDSTKNIIYYYQEVGQQKKEKSIQLSFHEGKYQYEGITSNNLYEVIVRSSLFSTLFGHGEQHVAVTEESMKLPYEEQPWFIGGVDGAELKEIEHGKRKVKLSGTRSRLLFLTANVSIQFIAINL